MRKKNRDVECRDFKCFVKKKKNQSHFSSQFKLRTEFLGSVLVRLLLPQADSPICVPSLAAPLQSTELMPTLPLQHALHLALQHRAQQQ